MPDTVPSLEELIEAFKLAKADLEAAKQADSDAVKADGAVVSAQTAAQTARDGARDKHVKANETALHANAIGLAFLERTMQERQAQQAQQSRGKAASNRE